jgi:outer membrane protein assembly factor BamD (BamD/ComL family)
MPKELSKQDTRRNPLVVWVGTALQFGQGHKALVGGILAGALVATAAAGAYGWYQERQERAAQTLFVKAQAALIPDKQGAPVNPEEAKKVYAEIADGYPGTVSAEESLIRLGNLQYDGGKTAEAIVTFGRYLTTYPRGRFRVMAGVGKAYAEEAAGNLPAAEKTLSDLLPTVANDPLAGEAYSSLAHVYEAMKKPEEAARVYGQISERFAQTHWGQNAVQRMGTLKTK